MMRIILIIVVIFFLVVVLIPVVLNLIGIDILHSNGKSVSGGRNVMLRSLDGGGEWRVTEFSGRGSPGAIFDLAFHPENIDVIFAGTKSSGLWKSLDGGVTWERIQDNAGILKPGADVYKIAIAPSNPAVIYLGVYQDTRGRVLKSEDNGNSFREVYAVAANHFGVFDLYVDPANPNSVVAATGQGLLLESDNGGKTWRILRNFGEPVTTLAVNPIFFQEMYAATSRGKLFKTFDGGATWTDITDGVAKVARGIERQEINPFVGLQDFFSPAAVPLVIDPHNPATLYIGTRAGLLRSMDGGFNWERLNTLLSEKDFPARGIALHPSDQATLFVGAGQTLNRSDDRGINWRVTILPARGAIKKIIIHPRKPEVMFVLFGR